jgi:hypothetical protein
VGETLTSALVGEGDISEAERVAMETLFASADAKGAGIMLLVKAGAEGIADHGVVILSGAPLIAVMSSLIDKVFAGSTGKETIN